MTGSPRGRTRVGPPVSFAFQPREDGKTGTAPSSQVARNSDLICRLVREASLRNGAGFIDARRALRKAAWSRLIHGPRDWTHLNEAGYRTLGALVAARLDQRTHDACDAGASE